MIEDLLDMCYRDNYKIIKKTRNLFIPWIGEYKTF